MQTTTLGYAKAQQKVKEAHATYKRRRHQHTLHEFPYKKEYLAKDSLCSFKGNKYFFKLLIILCDTRPILSYLILRVKQRFDVFECALRRYRTGTVRYARSLTSTKTNRSTIRYSV